MAEEPAKRTKRRVKDPETFRERAANAQSDGNKPRRLKQAAEPAAKSAQAAAASPALKPFRFIGKILVPRYFRNSWQELKLVKWPTRRESRRLTVAVLIFAIIFGLTIAGVDWVLDKAFRQLLLQ
jgi:preprotein translocase SecE subunit